MRGTSKRDFLRQCLRMFVWMKRVRLARTSYHQCHILNILKDKEVLWIMRGQYSMRQLAHCSCARFVHQAIFDGNRKLKFPIRHPRQDGNDRNTLRFCPHQKFFFDSKDARHGRHNHIHNHISRGHFLAISTVIMNIEQLLTGH